MLEFTSIPTELQLSVLDFLPARTLLNFAQANHVANTLTASHLNSTVNKLTNENNKLFISVFSPQNKARLVETYNTVCLSNPNSVTSTPAVEKADFSCTGLEARGVDMNKVSEQLQFLANSQKEATNNQSTLFHALQHQSKDLYHTIFKLGNIQYTRDPLQFQSKEAPASPIQVREEKPINLIVNEDEPFIKLQLEMQLKSFSNSELSSLLKFSSRISPPQTFSSGTLESEDKTISVDYSIQKGEEVPPNGGYDYDVFHNYYLRLGTVKVNSSYLLHRIEQSN